MAKKIKIILEIDEDGKIDHSKTEIKDQNGKKIESEAEPAGAIAKFEDTIKIYKVNPYWVYIGGRWYKIG